MEEEWWKELKEIEEDYYKVKALLRRDGARTLEDHSTAIWAALRTITPQNASGWFTHSGYLHPERPGAQQSETGLLRQRYITSGRRWVAENEDTRTVVRAARLSQDIAAGRNECRQQCGERHQRKEPLQATNLLTRGSEHAT